MPPVVIGAVALGGAAVAAGGLTAAFAAGGLIGFAANFGASMLLSGAAQSLMPSPTVGSLALRSRAVTVREPVMPRDMVYGRTRKGGVIVFLHSTGTADKDLHLVIVLAAHRVKSIGAIYFEGEMAFDATGNPIGRWAHSAYVEKRLGSEAQTAFEGLREAAPEHWTEAHQLRGCAAIYLRLTFDADVYPGGIPNVTVDIEGKDDIYDPRLDRLGYSENPALCLADYMAHPRFGIGAGIGEADGLHLESLIETANICDEEVALREGGVEVRYSCNGVIALSETPKTIIEALLTAMAGRAVWQRGQWHLRAGAYRMPSEVLTRDDVCEGGLALSTRHSRSVSFNAVRGQFVSPEHAWQPDDFPALRSDVYRAEDNGEEVWRDIALPFTISSSMAQRLAKIELERHRRQQSLRISGKLTSWRVGAGETVLFYDPRWGFAGESLESGKPFEVLMSRLELADSGTASGTGVRLITELMLRETSPLVYEWSALEEQVYTAAPLTTLPSAFDIPPPGAPQGEEELYVTRDGSAVKVLLRVSWAQAESGFVEDYQFEARRDGENWQDYGRTTGHMMELRDIAPGKWDFRVKARSVLGVSSEWRSGTREVMGLTLPPDILRGLTIQSLGGLAVLKWERSSDVDVRVGGNVIIRHSKDSAGTWANSTLMDRVSGSEAIAVVPLKPGSYLLRAEDSEGRLGGVSRVSTKGVQILSFSEVNTMRADPAFLGAKHFTEVVQQGLQLSAGLDGSGTPIVLRNEGLYEFEERLDFGALKRVRLRSDILVGATQLSDVIDDRRTYIDAWADFDGSEGADIDVVLEVRETDHDPTSAAVEWGPWGRIDNSEIEAWAVEARAWLRTRDPAFTPIVSELRLIADAVNEGSET